MSKTIHNAANNSYLGIAIQTVLYNYKEQLKNMNDNEEELYKEIAEQIQTQAIQFREVAEYTLGQLEKK